MSESPLDCEHLLSTIPLTTVFGALQTKFKSWASYLIPLSLFPLPYKADTDITGLLLESLKRGHACKLLSLVPDPWLILQLQQGWGCLRFNIAQVGLVTF